MKLYELLYKLQDFMDKNPNCSSYEVLAGKSYPTEIVGIVKVEDKINLITGVDNQLSYLNDYI